MKHLFTWVGGLLAVAGICLFVFRVADPWRSTPHHELVAAVLLVGGILTIQLQRVWQRLGKEADRLGVVARRRFDDVDRALRSLED